MTYDTNKLFKTGLENLLHYSNTDEGPNCLLQENYGLTPDRVSLIKKYRSTSLDILGNLVDRSLNPSQEKAGTLFGLKNLTHTAAPTPEEIPQSKKHKGHTSTYSTESLKEFTNIPALGLLHHEDEKSIRKSMRNENRRIFHGSRLPESMHLVSHFAPLSTLTLGFRTLMPNLTFHGLGTKIKTLAVTSIFQGEGKTTVAANLAIIMAREGMKTLLAGADLKIYSTSKPTDKETLPGLTNFLLGNYSWRKEIKSISDFMPQVGEIASDELGSLHILTNGTEALNVADSIYSKRLKKFVREAKKEYNIIIFDTSPCLYASDPIVLGKKVDAVLLVSRKRDTSERTIKPTTQDLQQYNCSIIGMVINDVTISNPRREQEATD